MKHEEVKAELKLSSMSKVAERLSILKMSTALRNGYMNYSKELASYREAYETVEAKGEARGIEKGKEEGMKLGEARGREEGKLEEKLAIARGVLKDKEPKEKVSKWTGLGSKQIEQLLQELSQT